MKTILETERRLTRAMTAISKTTDRWFRQVAEHFVLLSCLRCFNVKILWPWYFISSNTRTFVVHFQQWTIRRVRLPSMWQRRHLFKRLFRCTLQFLKNNTLYGICIQWKNSVGMSNGARIVKEEWTYSWSENSLVYYWVPENLCMYSKSDGTNWRKVGATIEEPQKGARLFLRLPFCYTGYVQ